MSCFLHKYLKNINISHRTFKKQLKSCKSCVSIVLNKFEDNQSVQKNYISGRNTAELVLAGIVRRFFISFLELLDKGRDKSMKPSIAMSGMFFKDAATKLIP